MELQFPYQVIRSKRKTIAIQILPSGGVLVRCPNRMGKGQIEDFVRSRADWIHAHLPREPVQSMTEVQLRELARQAAEYFPKRAAFFAPLVGVSYGRITIRSQKTRWGSCSGKGNLNFNSLLMLAPPEVADYVVVHELCHRKHMNHSPAFWAEVARVMPDYERHRVWLKENGGKLLGRLPG